MKFCRTVLLIGLGAGLGAGGIWARPTMNVPITQTAAVKNMQEKRVIDWAVELPMKMYPPNHAPEKLTITTVVMPEQLNVVDVPMPRLDEEVPASVVMNRGSREIYVKPEIGGAAIPVVAGGNYHGFVDGVATSSGKVYKVTDPFGRGGVVVRDDSIILWGPVFLNEWMGGGVLPKAPDQGWEALFREAAKAKAETGSAE